MIEHWKNLSLENLTHEYEGVLYNEQWKKIVGYEGLYDLSNFGRVKSLERRLDYNDILIKEHIVSLVYSNGYPACQLWKNNKGYKIRVHILVGKHFIDNLENKPTVNHWDGIKTNNFYLNLQWFTQSEQEFHKYRILKIRHSMKDRLGKLHAASIPIVQLSMEGEFIKDYECAMQVDREFGKFLSPSLPAVLKGRKQHAYGFKWMYKTDYEKMLTNQCFQTSNC